MGLFISNNILMNELCSTYQMKSTGEATHYDRLLPDGLSPSN